MSHTPKSQESKPPQRTAASDADESDVEFESHVAGHIESDATGKNILIRDIDANDDTSELRLLEDSVPDDSDAAEGSEASEVSEPDEFDPYNSGVFKPSELPSWKSRSRK